MNLYYILDLLNKKLKELEREIEFARSTISTYLEDDETDWKEEIQNQEDYIDALKEEKEIVRENINYLTTEHCTINHKYIEDITDIENTPYGWNKGDGRSIEWKMDRDTYGFDERETWSLDSTFMYWLYERLMMFREVNHIDLDFHKFNIKGNEMTQRECIDKIIENCKIYIQNRYIDDELAYDLKNETLEIWKECIHSMWW